MFVTPEPEQTRAASRHARGERSREAILDAAAQVATVEGIDGLSIGRLAQAVGMSKSGLFGHFAGDAGCPWGSGSYGRRRSHSVNQVAEC